MTVLSSDINNGYSRVAAPLVFFVQLVLVEPIDRPANSFQCKDDLNMSIKGDRKPARTK